MREEVGGVEGRRIPLYCMGRGAQQQRREYVEKECVERGGGGARLMCGVHDDARDEREVLREE